MENENELNKDMEQTQLAEQPADLRRDIGTPIIKVLGVGGGGSNAVTRMYKNRTPGIDYIVVNTDRQALESSDVPNRLRIGDKTARGLGVGGDPSMGRTCMSEDSDKAREVLSGSDMVFVAAGMGGGTGTGAAPIVAEIAREIGALTIGVVTKPFAFEGALRQQQALDGIEELKQHVDTLIVIPNDRLQELSDKRMAMQEAFQMADNVLKQGVQAIAELILVAGEINLDFADVRTVMDKAGPAWMAIGRGSGENRAIKAAQAAMNSPMLEVDVQGATGIIFNVTGGHDLTMQEVNDASEFIHESAHPEASIIFGTATDPTMEGEVKITIVATGFHSDSSDMPQVGGYHQANDILEQVQQSDVDVPAFLHTHPAVMRKFKAQARRKQLEEAERLREADLEDAEKPAEAAAVAAE